MSVRHCLRGHNKRNCLSVVSDEYICLNYDQFYIAYMQILFSPKAFSYRICAVGISVRGQEWTFNVTQKFRFMLYIREFQSELHDFSCVYNFLSFFSHLVIRFEPLILIQFASLGLCYLISAMHKVLVERM